MAITMVLLCHGRIAGQGFGFIGVNTFFVLSGFLITSLLAAEWDRSGRIHFAHFYIRRALRLLPALGVMLAAFIVFFLVTMPPNQFRPELTGSLAALFYFKNWAHILGWPTGVFFGHTWSLSIEEQFYLLWPLLLLCLLRYQKRQSALCWILLGVALSMAIRFFYSTGTDIANSNPDRLTAGPDTRADSLLLGCFAGLALTSKQVPQTPRFRSVINAIAPLALAGLLLLAAVDVLRPWMICWGWSLASALAMILILALVPGESPLQRLFENPALVYLGRISYGLYLWHYPVLMAMQQHRWPWEHLLYVPVVLVPVLLSYYLVERPCLRLKRFFSHAA